MLKVIVFAGLFLTPFGFMALGCSSASTSPEASAPGALKSETAAPSADGVEAHLINNKLCPISGEPVGSMEAGAHVDYNGQRIGLCCSGCANSFNKDPETNLAKAKADAAAAS